MKKILFAAVCLAAAVGTAAAQKTITIRGSIRFPAEQGDMEIIESHGFDKVTLLSAPVNPDGTFEFKFTPKQAGAYTLSCQGGHQRVQIWAEDEDLDIAFRGRDTSRVRYIGPTYVHIKGGPNNDFMNKVAWEQCRNYWCGVDASRAIYRNESLSDEEKQSVFAEVNNALAGDYRLRLAHLIRYYGDTNSVLTVLPDIKNREPELYAEVLAAIEARNPGYEPLVRYQKEVAEAEAARKRIAQGQQAPEFSYETPDGKRKLGPKDFRGKFLVIDFWASWCGPCRSEIPELKETYEAYKDKGVEILSVSIDKNDEAWRRAMKEEGMPWPQVKAPDVGKEAMQLYQFRGIPHIVLIDREGNIVGKDYRGQALRDKLDEVLNAKEVRSIPAFGM